MSARRRRATGRRVTSTSVAATTATSAVVRPRVTGEQLAGVAVAMTITGRTIFGDGTLTRLIGPCRPSASTTSSMRRGATLVLDDVSLAVRAGERWLVLGANGSGKTSLLRIAALYEHPTSGTVEVLGERLGRTDVRELRRRIGYASAALADQLRPDRARSTSCARPGTPPSSRGGTATPPPTTSGRADCLDRMGVARFAERPLELVVVGRAPARAAGPHADERPGDRAARRAVGAPRPRRARAARARPRRPRPPILTPRRSCVVTHHVDDIPPSMTHALLLRDGRVLRRGPIDEVLDAEALSECFGLGSCSSAARTAGSARGLGGSAPAGDAARVLDATRL